MPETCGQTQTKDGTQVTPDSAGCNALPRPETALPAAQSARRARETPEQRRARFTALAEPLYPAIYRAAVRVSRDPDLASDLTQDAFLRAYEKFHQFRDGTNFRAWVMRILVNGYINRYRKQKRTPDQVAWDEVTVGEELDLATQPDAPQTPENEVVQGISAHLVRQAVARLPEPFRTAVVLADLEGLSYEEVRLALGVPLGTVRSRIFRGRRLLMAVLEPHRSSGAL